jgi:hypothetical protein
MLLSLGLMKALPYTLEAEGAEREVEEGRPAQVRPPQNGRLLRLAQVKPANIINTYFVYRCI